MPRRAAIAALVCCACACACAACRDGSPPGASASHGSSASETEPPPPPAATSTAPRQADAPHADTQTSWRKLGEWSGSGSIQTESFATDTGALRVRWKAKAISAGREGHGKAPHFTLAIHSSISGRPLGVAVDRDTPGEGVAYVTDDPHTCFAKVDADGFDWSFTVDEGVTGTVSLR